MGQQLDLDRIGEIPDPCRDRIVVAPSSSLAAALVAGSLQAARTRAQVRRFRVLALGGALLYALGMVAMMGFRADLAKAPTAVLGASLLAPLAAAALAFRTATRVGPSGLGAASVRVASGVLAAIGLFGIGMLVVGRAEAGLSGRAFWVGTWMCFAGSLVLAAGPLLLALLAFRHAFAASAKWRSAALGVASGAFAAFALDLHCPMGGRWHLLLGHGAVLVVGGLVGFGLARVTRA